MASTCFRFMCCHLRKLTPTRLTINAISKGSRPAPKLILLSTFVALCDDNAKQKSSNIEDKHKDPDHSTLTTEYLLRNASLSSLDSALRLLSVTTVALSDVEKEYARWAFVLVKFMKVRLTVLGKPGEEERVWDLILQTRHKLGELKQRRLDLTLLYQTVITMVSAAAEAALIAGIEYQVSSANEAMQSSQLSLKGIQDTSLEAEKELTNIQVETIAKETKHAEAEEKKKEKKKENEEKNQQEGEEKITKEAPEGEKETGREENLESQEVIITDFKTDELDRLNKERYVTFVDDSKVGENNDVESDNSDSIFNENVQVDSDDKATEKEIFLEEIKKDKFDPDQWKDQ
ncbi:uncharacterized protein LOC110462100 [Mizuhopecten yessoensis]|uniref:Direct IAP-binding protein with low pI n=1 Tax=Mizuhopecten yessoensis TaxID=6573 RepID=A0A210PYW3_MIZYE|nr:uncharacterized protein LOC110462100 [Mizuhopecten yessoensis]OWF41676.1 Diablo-like [Mizuhopecten yessoensis]